jgi:hypothetical protein
MLDFDANPLTHRSIPQMLRNSRDHDVTRAQKPGIGTTKTNWLSLRDELMDADPFSSCSGSSAGSAAALMLHLAHQNCINGSKS